jgi:serine/threonine protein kinase
MSLEAGRTLGVYEVISPIGKGGMGEVYRARDTKLERDVAIKVLPAELASDEALVARFEREAKLLASLNHPNIASIHGVEESDGVRALVLELIGSGRSRPAEASNPSGGTTVESCSSRTRTPVSSKLRSSLQRPRRSSGIE